MPFSWKHTTVSYSACAAGVNSRPSSLSRWLEILYGCFLGFTSSEHLPPRQHAINPGNHKSYQWWFRILKRERNTERHTRPVVSGDGHACMQRW